MKEFWTPTEKRFLRDQYQRLTAAEIVQYLGRHTVTSVYRVAQLLGLKKDQHWKRPPTGWQTTLRARHAEQWSDSEIAAELHMDRRYVSELRTRLGLPPNGDTPRRRRKVSERTREQCRKAGVKSLAEVRRLAFCKYARDHGWEETLHPRAVQILELLFDRGLMSRRQIVVALGLTLNPNQNKWLIATGTYGRPQTTYLSVLMQAGLVVKSPRVMLPGTTPGKHKRQGKTAAVYGLSPLGRQTKLNFLRKQAHHEPKQTAVADGTGRTNQRPRAAAGDRRVRHH